jgi:hypothetical protein
MCTVMGKVINCEYGEEALLNFIITHLLFVLKLHSLYLTIICFCYWSFEVSVILYIAGTNSHKISASLKPHVTGKFIDDWYVLYTKNLFYSLVRTCVLYPV